MPEIIGEYVDRLSTIEMRPGQANIPRGVMHRLYEAAREQAGRPLTLRAAEALIEEVGVGDSVFILTGAGGPPILPYGEVDGLLGTAFLAHTLHFLRGAKPIVLTESRVEGPLRATCRAAGLNFRREDEAPMDHAVAFVPMPVDDEACQEQAGPLLDRYEPSAVIAVEKLSPNDVGAIHGVTGLSYTDMHAKPQYLFQGAEERGILTVGIGDGGNEVGYGVIKDAVAEILPAGRVCQCPCEGGTAASVATDCLVVAAISNWGAYAVSAMIHYLEGHANLSLTEEDLERMLRSCVDAGALDGGLGRPVLSDDGVPLDVHRAFLTMLRGCIAIGASSLDSPGH